MTHEDQRSAKRYPFKWRVAIVFETSDEQESYHGVTHDISSGGCAVLTEHNIFTEHPVTVLISLPVEHPGGRPKIIEVRARMVYTVLSAGHRKFRCGIQFVQFKEGSRAVLKSAFARRNVLED